MTPSGYGRYAKAAAAVEKKEDILMILLDTLAMDLKKARMGMEDNNFKVKGEAISRAVAILTELDSALDHDTGKELAGNLSRLYGYMMDQLTAANLKNDVSVLDEVAQVLAHLHDGFREAVSTRKAPPRQAAVNPFETQGEKPSQMTRSFSVAV